MASLAVHDRKAPDGRFEAFLPIIRREAGDRRNFVRKAVNWALREIGKRNPALNEKAVETARRILDTGERSARWVADGGHPEVAFPIRRLDDLAAVGNDLLERFVDTLDEDVRPHACIPGNR